MYVDISKELGKKCLHYLKFSMLNKIFFSITWKTIVFFLWDALMFFLKKSTRGAGQRNFIFERMSPSLPPCCVY